MSATQPTMKMPELLLFVKSLCIGFVMAEVGQVAFYLGSSFAQKISDVPVNAQVIGIFFILIICLSYLWMRNAHIIFLQIVRSLRVDLLTFLIIGITIKTSISPWSESFQKKLNIIDTAYWSQIVFIILLTLLISPLTQKIWQHCLSWLKPQKTHPQVNLIPDEEISEIDQDQLESEQQAKSFAEAVLASGAHSGLVFGIDGPWGIGKTSFINLAENHWKTTNEKVIVCRFEPLRYAADPDLADRLIRDLSAAIQRKVFAPEFRSAASKYSRLIKGKTDVSFLGFKLYVEPSKETIDELLDDIDNVLKRIGYRVIIVIDDLDRLDSKAVNNVLFATRQTFKLSQATYVLCYDTEVLAGSHEDNSRAREFLEKFVTAKINLFIDSTQMQAFLRGGWQAKKIGSNLTSANSLIIIGSVLSELADIFDGNQAANYMPIIGNLRKVKRFVNTMLLLQIDNTDLEQTDFNKQDLINLMLLHLNYPGIFRKIYAEETSNRSGMFSVHNDGGFKNDEKLHEFIKNQPDEAKFLLVELFDVNNLGINTLYNVEADTIASRACFNHNPHRNLEKYLKLIVRFISPEPQETYFLYQHAIEQIRKGVSIDSILKSSSFDLKTNRDDVHYKFWNMLANQSHDFTKNVAEDAINTLVDYLPHYNSTPINAVRGLRQSSIYSLLKLLDNTGWGRTSGRHLTNSKENVIEIAWRIFGENIHTGNGLLHRLTSNDRGILGWHDVMLFRLSCCADRGGQLYNLQKALIINQDENAATTGLSTTLSLIEMRKISQKVFALFKETYIDKKINFYTEAELIPESNLLGKSSNTLLQTSPKEEIAITRLNIKNFVIYQLSNSLPPEGSGVGCGYYDEAGANDKCAIAKLMNNYVFEFCFNPDIDQDNIRHFLDHCLSHLSSSFQDEDEFYANKVQLPGGLDKIQMVHYWEQHKIQIREYVQQIGERFVYTSNYTASYIQDLSGVFTELDELANNSMPPNSMNTNNQPEGTTSEA